MKSVLGLDTSFLSFTSIGWHFGGGEKLELNLDAPLSQEEKLLFAVDSGFGILKRKVSETELIAAGIGPGSFTGLRIGLATAKGLAWSLGREIIGLSSLDLLARSVMREGDSEVLAVPVVDARMGRVFSALYSGTNRVSDDLDVKPEELAEMAARRPERKVVFFGDGLAKYSSDFGKMAGKETLFIGNAYIRGHVICELALEEYGKRGASDLRKLEPVYLRKSEAEAKKEERSAATDGGKK